MLLFLLLLVRVARGGAKERYRLLLLPLLRGGRRSRGGRGAKEGEEEKFEKVEVEVEPASMASSSCSSLLHRTLHQLHLAPLLPSLVLLVLEDRIVSSREPSPAPCFKRRQREQSPFRFYLRVFVKFFRGPVSKILSCSLFRFHFTQTRRVALLSISIAGT